MAIETSLSYPDISAQGFAHPADRAAAAALHTVPMLDRVIKKLSEVGYERKLRQLMLGTAVRLGEDQLPAVWAMQRRYAHTFDISRCPQLYVTQYPVGNALTIGANEPVTLVSSGLARSFESDELDAVLAHEMGHVLADHVTFMTTFELVQLVMNGVLRGAPLAGLPLKALYYALLEWSRAAELTADRASALGTGDPLLTCRTLMRMAGGPVPGLDLDAFIRQATEYEGEGDPFARYSRFWSEIGTTHPFPVRRVRELIAWLPALAAARRVGWLQECAGKFRTGTHSHSWPQPSHSRLDCARRAAVQWRSKSCLKCSNRTGMRPRRGRPAAPR